ncbi:hypothetical protein NESM_000089600 [Novymonas esmeraldas]|uniref:Uncharacterized protein n=1 Tax=Novymonas esmeraldas TaxID=1808958 RepID=A0AAW0F3I1_9TRYP
MEDTAPTPTDAPAAAHHDNSVSGPTPDPIDSHPTAATLRGAAAPGLDSTVDTVAPADTPEEGWENGEQQQPQQQPCTASGTPATTPRRRATTSKGKARRGGAAASAAAPPLQKVKVEEEEEGEGEEAAPEHVAGLTGVAPSATDSGATRREDEHAGSGADEPRGQRSERPERHLPTAAGVLTRRATAERIEGEAAATDVVGPHQQQQLRISCDGQDGSRTPSVSGGGGGVVESRRSRSRSLSTAPQTPSEPAPTSPVSASVAGARQEEEAEAEATVQAAVQAAIDAQERQLRRTLLNIFPADLQHLDTTVATPGTVNLPTSAVPPPEPLLPLLTALCEDAAYVHAAWVRYEDDLAVRRTRNSIQRKRQRHSFNKGGRRAPARRRDADGVDDGEDSSSGDDDDGDTAREEAELQPPEWQWVEAPPAFVSGGLQWAPWCFYREKRRRTSRRPAETAAAAAGVRPAVVAAVGQSGLIVASAAVGAATGGGGGGGVPSLAHSHVPSLPVLQVDADVPESPLAVVLPTTPEERKAYARYTMSSGKLRHDCRDPYAFLVSRAKEMRIQWVRQHPME